MHYIITNGGIHLVVQGKPFTVARTDSNYEKVVEAVKAKASDAEVLEILTGKITRLAQKVQLSKYLALRGGVAFYKGEPLDELLSARLQQMVEEGFDLQPIESFLENLAENPSHAVCKALYRYLEIAKSPLTEDGCFLAYTVVDEGYLSTSPYAGRHLPGHQVKVPRNKIQENFNMNCDVALQVWSYEQAKTRIPEDGHLLICKVNPKDVVAVDEGCQRLRVCAYDVLYEYDVYEVDVLSTSSVATTEKPFVLETYDFDGKVVGTLRFDSLLTAAQEFERFKPRLESFIRNMKLFNSASSTVISSYDNPDFEDCSDATLGATSNQRYVVEVTDTAGVSKKHTVYSLTDAIQLMTHHMDASSVKVFDSTGALIKSLG
jgi:hypothetical protein